MRVRLTELLPDPERSCDFAFALPPDPDDDALALVEPAEAAVRLDRTGALVRVRGRVRARVGLACDACLAAIERPLRAAFDEEFALGTAADEGRDRLDAASFITPIGEAGDLDLGALVREHLVMALPMGVRCRDDCRGLCPQCGADRNEVECGHAPSPVDPRLAALGRWLDRPAEEE